MAVSVIPALTSALYEATTDALPDTNVSLGKNVTDDPGDYLMIGLDDPDEEWASFASATRTWETVGIDADVREEGDIPCFAFSWNGDSDVAQARDAVFGIAEALGAVVRDNPNLGLIQVSWALYASDLDCQYALDDDGVKMRLPLSIHFVALI